MPIQNRCLIIVEGSGINLPEIDWESLLPDVKGFQEATLLWMTDEPYDSLLSLFSEKKILTTVVEAAPLLQQEMCTFHHEVEKWLKNLAEYFKDIPDLWLSRITEPNFSDAPWFDLVRFNVIESELRMGSYTGCLAVSSSVIHRLVSKLCQLLKIEFYAHEISAPRSVSNRLIFLLRCWFRNFRSDFIAWLITKNFSKEQKADLLVYARFPGNWSKAAQTNHYRFTGLFSDALETSQKKGAYLVSVSRRNSSSLKNIKTVLSDWKALRSFPSDMPAVPAEGFGSFMNLLASYCCLRNTLKWLGWWKAFFKSEKMTWRNVDIKFLFINQIFSTLFLDWPSTLYLEKCTTNALKLYHVKSLIVPVFELVEGRAVVRAGKKEQVKTIGLQHGSAGLAHRWRIMTPAAIMAGKNSGSTPDITAVEGSLSAGWFSESGYSEGHIKVCGAPRLTKKITSPCLNNPGHNILILGDMHRPYTLFRWALKGLADMGYSLILRPHPSTYERTVAWLEAVPEKIKTHACISARGVTLENELRIKSPACILAGCTGAAVDLSMSGWPLIIILSNWLPDYSPLTAIDNQKILSSGSPSEVKAWIERLHSDLTFRQEYSRTCKQAGEQLIDSTGEKAVSKLAEII